MPKENEYFTQIANAQKQRDKDWGKEAGEPGESGLEMEGTKVERAMMKVVEAQIETELSELTSAEQREGVGTEEGIGEGVELEEMGITKEKKDWGKSMKKAMNVVLATISLYSASAMFAQKAEAGDVNYERSVENVLNRASQGLGKGLGKTFERITTFGKDENEEIRDRRDAKNEQIRDQRDAKNEQIRDRRDAKNEQIRDQREAKREAKEQRASYDRERRELFRNYLEMSKKNPDGAKQFLNDGLEGLNKTYGIR